MSKSKTVRFRFPSAAVEAQDFTNSLLDTLAGALEDKDRWALWPRAIYGLTQRGLSSRGPRAEVGLRMKCWSVRITLEWWSSGSCPNDRGEWVPVGVSFVSGPLGVNLEISEEELDSIFDPKKGVAGIHWVASARRQIREALAGREAEDARRQEHTLESRRSGRRSTLS